MKKFITFFLLLSTICKAAIVTVCPSGCTTTSLQAAFDTVANCGDTIQIKTTTTYTGNFTNTYRGCTALTPITVEPDRITFETNPFARTTPSHLGNMAQIITPNSNPALRGVLDGSNRPPAHWVYIAIAFSTTSGTFDLVGYNINGEATNSSEIADDITFDRCYFYMQNTGNYGAGGTAIQDVIRGDATNLTVKNSYIGDSFYNGYVESHGVRPLTNAGPVTLTNNFVTTSTIPFFVGGATPSYPVYLPNGMTSQYNYFWRPWKYNGDPAQPYASQYEQWAQNTLRTGPWNISNVSNTGVLTTMGSPPFIGASLLNITGVTGCTVANANGWRISVLGANSFQILNFPGCNAAYIGGGTINEYAVTVCTKNLGELKWGIGVTWEYNAGENSWESQGFCQSQWTGFTDTFRTQWDSTITTPTIGMITMTDTSNISWSGSYRIPGTSNIDINDNALCLSLPTTGTECHPIASIAGASVVMTSPFSATTFNPTGWFVYTGSAQYKNVTISHNIYKNVDSALTILALSFANGVGDNGYGKNNTISNNLWFTNSSYTTGWNGFAPGSAEADDNWNPSGFIFDHNTIYNPNGLANGAFVYVSATNCGACATANTPKFDLGAWTNNLFGISAAGGNGPFSGDGVNTIGDTTNSYMSNTNVENNAIPGGAIGPAASGGNTISGNQLQAWVDPFGGTASQNIFVVQSTSAYYNAGTDSLSLGADWQTLPMVTNVTVHGTTLTFDLNNQNNAVKTNQPCTLEVSTSQNLQTDLGSYSTIADLDPTLVAGADLTTRTDVIVSGNSVIWPLNGLSNATVYYGKLQCYGDTEMFTFTASPISGNLGANGKGKALGKIKLQ